MVRFPKVMGMKFGKGKKLFQIRKVLRIITLFNKECRRLVGLTSQFNLEGRKGLEKFLRF